MFTMEPEELRERNVERIPETLGTPSRHTAGMSL